MKLVSKNWVYKKLKTSLQKDSKINLKVKLIINDVKRNGDKAILKYVKKFENPNASIKNFEITKNELKDAYESIGSRQKSALKLAYKRIHFYHSKQQKKSNPMSYEDRDKDIVFTIDMPGVQKKDIDISIEEHSIKVSAQNEKGRNYNYTRRFKPTVDESSAVATFTNGVLDITVSKVEEKEKGTKVKIK